MPTAAMYQQVDGNNAPLCSRHGARLYELLDAAKYDLSRLIECSMLLGKAPQADSLSCLLRKLSNLQALLDDGMRQALPASC